MSRQRGNEVENVVANLIIKKGGQILARNLYCKMGEIDIVALKARVLVFIEVKYRKSAIFGSAAEMVSYQKQHSISYLNTPNLSLLSVALMWWQLRERS